MANPFSSLLNDIDVGDRSAVLGCSVLSNHGVTAAGLSSILNANADSGENLVSSFLASTANEPSWSETVVRLPCEFESDCGVNHGDDPSVSVNVVVVDNIQVEPAVERDRSELCTQTICGNVDLNLHLPIRPDHVQMPIPIAPPTVAPPPPCSSVKSPSAPKWSSIFKSLPCNVGEYVPCSFETD